MIGDSELWFVESFLQLLISFFIQVREIRRAVLLNRGAQDDYDSDTEWENTESVAGTVSSQPSQPPYSRPESAITVTDVDEYPDISGITNAREAMKKLPEEDRAKIEQQVFHFYQPVMKGGYPSEILYIFWDF